MGRPVIHITQAKNSGGAGIFKINTRYHWNIDGEQSKLTYATPSLARKAARKHLEKKNGGHTG